MLFQEFLIESKLDSSSFQPHMYDIKTAGPSTLKGIRVSALCPQNYSCSFIHLDSIYQFERLLVLHHTLAESLEGRVNKHHAAALSALSIESQQAPPRWRDCKKGSGEMDYPSQIECCLFILMGFCYLRGTPQNMDSLLFITPGFSLALTHFDAVVMAAVFHF